MRGARRRLTILIMTLAVAGCASTTAPTPIIVLITPTPGETATPTAEPTTSPSESPSESPSVSPSESPSESPSVSPSESPSESPSPSGSPTSPAAGCTGSEAHKEYFANAANNLPFDVYCAVLPSGWWLQASEYHRANEYLYVLYRNNAGIEVILISGRLCADLSTCMDLFPVLDSASFDGLAGTMRSIGGSGHGVFVSPHSVPGYALVNPTGLSQAKVAQYAAAVIKVPKPES
jgi:hypothetical protein